MALYDGWRALGITIAAMTVALAVPLIAVGSPDYPPIEWRRAAVLVGIAIIIGASIQTLVRRVRQRGEEAARGREFLLAVMNSAAEGIVSIDVQGRVMYANPSGCELLGYDPSDLRGANFHALVHHTYADGSPYPHDECPIHETMIEGTSRAVEDDLFWRSDGTSFPVSYTSSRIDSWAEPDDNPGGRGDARREAGIVVTFSDITERRGIERMKDEFVSVVGHELRTPLTSIRGSLGLMAGGVFGELADQGKRMLDDRGLQHRPARAADQRHPRHRADRVGARDHAEGHLPQRRPRRPGHRGHAGPGRDDGHRRGERGRAACCCGPTPTGSCRRSRT